MTEKQPKCSLYRGTVNNCFLTVLRCTTQHSLYQGLRYIEVH